MKLNLEEEFVCGLNAVSQIIKTRPKSVRTLITAESRNERVKSIVQDSNIHMIEVIKEKTSFFEDNFKEINHQNIAVVCNKRSEESEDFLESILKNENIGEKDSKVLYQELYDIFINKLNIRSQKDIISHCPSENENIITKWSDIKKRQLKQFYINNYIIDMKNKYNLSATNVDLLVYYIVIGMLFKQLVQCDSDIIFKDERIIKIDGISFKNNKVITTKNIYNYSNNKIKYKNETKENMYKNWVKYNK
mgnify:CR=1 FL=1